MQSQIFQVRTLKRRNVNHLTLQSEMNKCDTDFLIHENTDSTIDIPSSNFAMKRDNKPCILDIPMENANISQSYSLTENKSSVESKYKESLMDLSSKLRDSFMLEEASIRLQDLLQLGRIGSGSSGTVVKALHVPDSRVIAKKTIKIGNDEIIKTQLIRELNIMKNVKTHDNIIDFYGACYSTSIYHEVVILMEYMDCGSLDSILKINQRYNQRRNKNIHPKNMWFSELALSKITYAILTGLVYLYEDYEIIHRDIKPSNILINSNGSVKLCDFGVSKQTSNSIANTFIGTSTYMSPERIQGHICSTKGDVWSLGLMIIELVTGDFPLGGHTDSPEGILDLLQKIVNEPPPKLPLYQCFSFELIDFVNKCCIKDEDDRSSLKELKFHKFIQKYNLGDTYHKKFQHWCKKIKQKIQQDKMFRREETERAKLLEIQLRQTHNSD